MMDEVAQWQVREQNDDTMVRDLLEQDRVWNSFALADLIPPMRQYTRFVMASHAGNKPSAMLLVVQHPAIRTISPFGDVSGVAAILTQTTLPDSALVQTTADHRPLLEAVYRPVPAWGEMLRMAVAAPTFTPRAACEPIVRLTTDDSAEVADLYRLFPENHFRPELLAQESFRGLRAHGRLVAIAGTHVVAEPYGIAVIGGVFTLPEERGKGYAGMVTSAVVANLLERGCRDVVLNVHAPNTPAIAVYHRLGFQTHHQLWSGPAERRQEPSR